MALAGQASETALERACVATGLPPSVPGILGATPSLRLPWLGAAALVSVLAATASSTPRQALMFLLAAPVVPVLGVAGAYGSWADPMDELQRSTALSGFHVLLVRTLAVLAVSFAVLGLAAPVLPRAAFGAWAWVLPALALSLSSLALSTVTSLVRAAAIVIVLWCATVAAGGAADALATLFGGAGQIGFLIVASCSSLVIARRRIRFDVEDLRSRRALVDAADAERSRIERNIHDGAQQQLVAIGVKAGVARNFVTSDPDRAIAILDELRTDAQEAVAGLRELTRGGYPPILADQGLEAALRLHAERMTLPVTIEAAAVGRTSRAVEVAVYFCCLEAMQNAAKYAGPSSIVVSIRSRLDQLDFSIRDDGIGFDLTIVRHGVGMRSMAERIESLGGSLDVRSRPGEGTMVLGRVPISASDDRYQHREDRPTSSPPA